MKQRVLAYVTRERDGVEGAARLRPPGRSGRRDAGSGRPPRSRRNARAVPPARAARGGGHRGRRGRPRARPSRPGRRSTRITHSRYASRADDATDTWDHVVHGDGDDAGLVFRYRWEPVRRDLMLFNRRRPAPGEAVKARRDRASRRSPSAAPPHPPRLAGCALFPADNPWNQRVDTLPVAANSAAIIASIGADTGLHPDFGSGMWDGGPIGIPYDVVDGDAARSVTGSSSTTPTRATPARTRSRRRCTSSAAATATR